VGVNRVTRPDLGSVVVYAVLFFAG
jgi:hypothetical protein